MVKAISIPRVSSLSDHLKIGLFGTEGAPQIQLAEDTILSLHQVAFWPDTQATITAHIAQAIGAAQAPGPGRAMMGTKGSALRIEPLKFWILDATPPLLTPDIGSHLDLSQSRTCIHISGEKATHLLNQHLPLDLRKSSFPVHTVASTAFHHVGVTLWKTEHGFKLFVPRSFAVSLWELLWESALQYGLDVK